MERLAYEYKGYIVLVPLGGQQLLIQMDETGINFLSAVDLTEAREAIDRFIATGCWYIFH